MGRGDFEVGEYDDGCRFPSWPGLVRRLRDRLLALPELTPFAASVETFFAKQPAIDAAQLFRDKVGEPNYVAFLREQFGTRPNDARKPTRSHTALVELPLSLLFTTNYDELIETAFAETGPSLRTSVTQAQFVSHRQERPPRHLVKLHRSIEQPDTIVLTRSDYARSRRDRTEMFRYLGDERCYSRFLFVGFSLSDPNFALLYDDARLALEGALPPSYVVQGQPDPIKEAYPPSLGVDTISLDWWEDLPAFLSAINPRRDTVKN